MSDEFRYIKFQGDPYILIGTEDGAITTERRFRAGYLGIAHLTPAGEVMQRGVVIATRDDIEFGETFIPSLCFVTPILN